LDSIVIHVVNIAGLDADILEEFSIIQSLLLLQLLLHGHLLELFGLDIFEHFGTFFLLLYLHLGAFIHVFLDLLNPLIISHVELDGGVQVNDCVFVSYSWDAPSG
jgi:hypothetical protein